MQAGPEAGADLYTELKIRLKSSNVWLLGMDGCQKNLVGDFLARKLGYRFIDTNSIIEQLAKVPIGSALQTLGEDSFVQVERAVLDQVAILIGRALA
jgi:shikimate kinase